MTDVTEPYVIVVDDREKAPYFFTGFCADVKEGGGRLVVPTKVARLETGDYSVEGWEGKFAVERKSLEDLYGSMTQRRENFKAEIQRMSYLMYTALVIEAPMGVIARGNPNSQWGSKAQPKAIFRTLLFWSTVHRIPVFPCENRSMAEAVTFRLLRYWWKKECERGKGLEGRGQGRSEGTMG